MRIGCRYNHDNGLLPICFLHEVGNEEVPIETWSEGVCLFHNPYAFVPLPKDFFAKGAGYHFFEDGTVVSMLPDFFPLFSMTRTYITKKRAE